MPSPVEQVTTDHGPRKGAATPSHLARYYPTALLARTADEGARVGLVLLALDRTGSAAVGGILVATLLVPHVVAAPLVGNLVDRARRPGLVLAAAVAVFAAGLASAGLLLGRGPLWMTFAVLVLAGSCGPAITGGLTSRLNTLVDPERQPRAFGLDSLFYNIASMVGPAGVAAVAAFAGPTVATLVLAGLAGGGAVGVLTLHLTADKLPQPDRRSPEDRSVARAPGFLDGARAIIHDPSLRNLTLTTSLGQLGPGALAVVATVLAVSLRRPAVGGFLLTAVAAGALLGSLLWTWRPLPAPRAPVVADLSMIGIGLPLAAVATIDAIGAGSLPLTAVLFGVSGIFIGPFAAALFVARNQLAPSRVRAQVFTIGAGLKVTASAAGAALIGFAVGLPVAGQLLLVASTPVLAGLLGVCLRRARPRSTHP